MRILHTVEFYKPSVGGAQEVVKQVSEQLVKRGHEVTVATTKLRERTRGDINGVKIEEFAISGSAVRGFSGEVERYQEFLLNGKFDIMMNYAAQQWSTDLVFPIIRRLPYRKVLVPCGFSGLFIPQYEQYFRKMPEILASYDRLVFHSDIYRDVEFARSVGLSHYTVIPNGASAEEFSRVDSTFRRRYAIPEDTPLLLTVGNHTGLKGHSATIESFRQARIGRSILVIIGNTHQTQGCLQDCKWRAMRTKLTSMGSKRVLLLNPPRRDVVAAYHAADLFVFGSNVECSPLVLFEALASNTPFITTACGNAGEIADWSHGGVVISTFRREDGNVQAHPNVMTRAIEDLLSNPFKRARLAEAGYKAWRERFTWEEIVTQYERLYQALVNG